MKHADHWFYVPTPSSKTVSFPAEEATHAAKVLRLQVGDGIQWLDGLGGRFVGKITKIDKRSLMAETVSSSMEEQPTATVLAVGQLHDAARLEWLVEKATELGVSEILLVATSRVERTRYKLARLEAKIISAVKQSGRAFVPVLKEASFAEALSLCKHMDKRFLAHCYQELERDDTWQAVDQEKSACLFIGPEGDFTVGEIEAANAAGYISVSLGPARLRTETAALAAIVRLRALRS